MDSFDEKIRLVTKLCGNIIKDVLGKDTDFIIMPIMEEGDKFKVGVISNLHPEQLCEHLGGAASATIKQLKGVTCDCDKTKEKPDNVTPINKDLH